MKRVLVYILLTIMILIDRIADWFHIGQMTRDDDDWWPT